VPAAELNSCPIAKAADVRRTVCVVNIGEKRGAAMRAAPHYSASGARILAGGLHLVVYTIRG